MVATYSAVGVSVGADAVVTSATGTSVTTCATAAFATYAAAAGKGGTRSYNVCLWRARILENNSRFIFNEGYLPLIYSHLS